MIAGNVDLIYRFDNGMLQNGDVNLTACTIMVGGYSVDLELRSPLAGMKL